MADPVTLAMMGAAAGAVTNKKDPLKGALLGATLGGVGGAVAPGLLAGAPAAGLAGITPMGAQAATGLLGAAPVAGPGMGAVLGAGAQSAAAPGLLSQMATPQSLMAGATLAGLMTPKQQGGVTALPLRQAQQSQVMMQDIPQITMSRINPQMVQNEEPSLGIFDTPGLIRSQITPDREYFLDYIPQRRTMR